MLGFHLITVSHSDQKEDMITKFPHRACHYNFIQCTICFRLSALYFDSKTNMSLYSTNSDENWIFSNQITAPDHKLNDCVWSLIIQGSLQHMAHSQRGPWRSGYLLSAASLLSYYLISCPNHAVNTLTITTEAATLFSQPFLHLIAFNAFRAQYCLCCFFTHVLAFFFSKEMWFLNYTKQICMFTLVEVAKWSL